MNATRPIIQLARSAFRPYVRVARSAARSIQTRYAARKGSGYRAQYFRNCIAETAEHANYGEPEAFFETKDHRVLPIYPDYRTAVGGSLVYEPIKNLRYLESKDLLADSERRFLHDAVGHRTLNVPLPEIEEYAKPIVERHSSLFFADSLQPGCIPTPIPSGDEIKEHIRTQYRRHRDNLSRLSDLGLYVARPGHRLLEVGHDDGGYSIFAYERLGMEVTGIANAYSGVSSLRPLAAYVKERVRSQAQFVFGDITTKTGFEEASFDVIYSYTVLEHLIDLPTALAEMCRLLKPGGIMIHLYNPWWAVNGGHTPGILDCPWGHLRIDLEDLLRYFDTVRPNEVPVARPSFLQVLNRGFPIAEVQHLLIDSGFEIRLWEEVPARHQLLADLTSDVARDCFRLNPGISMADLLSKDVFFVASN